MPQYQRAKNAKCAKTQKEQNIKIDPCSSPTPPEPKKLPKNRNKNHSVQRKVGLNENPPKKNKNAIYSKRAGSNISEPRPFRKGMTLVGDFFSP